MKVKFTSLYIEKLKAPESGRMERWDTEQRCFGIRVTQRGVKTWTLKCKYRGRQRRVVLGYYPEMSLVKARELARERLNGMQKGKDPGSPKSAAPEPTFGDLIEAYMERHAKLRNKEVSWRQDEQLIRDYIPAAWKRRELSTFKRPDVVRLHAEIGGKSIYAANHTLRLLKSMFNRAARDFEMFSGDNPAVGIKLLEEKKGTRYLSTDEMRRMIAALQEEGVAWRTYFMLALMLGSRRNELLAMRWTDIDFDQQMLRLPETKSGREHILPLPGLALELLQALPRLNDFVFAGSGETGHRINVKRAWKRICKRASVTGCRVHDLRHTVGSWLSMAGCNLQTVSRVLGHAGTAVTERYSHVNLRPVRTVLEANARAMFALSQTQAAEVPAIEVQALPTPEPQQYSERAVLAS